MNYLMLLIPEQNEKITACPRSYDSDNLQYSSSMAAPDLWGEEYL